MPSVNSYKHISVFLTLQIKLVRVNRKKQEMFLYIKTYKENVNIFCYTLRFGLKFPFGVSCQYKSRIGTK